ncbi:gamma-glutamyl-gamma-aminobutyrate hydrolase family protein [Hyphomicrobium sp.]|uniref:gamma-glutamyl-gamma-aminobutyrate hydrolase family protein n=1 Tax=Hyphomicrobium sp. TaxID=82 RepID=UPI002D77B360|nr:gamma-glutamyl-gamma-aminobutyrate hydrolase family protein [Hyphomicrobium sp.]HET6388444.1 gamma-glutamyl-gamma-aminobutyrate hydrolase family protein [Hyphomicrobium sp.]
MSRRPLVGVICCTRIPEDPVQGVAERYLRAAPFMGADFVLVPSMPEISNAASILSRLDGILLTGSPSNVAPHLYRSADAGEGPFDPRRDETAFRLISESVEQDRPVLGICRGFQEIAVAYGASLRRDLGQAERPQIHHTPPGLSMDEMFALEHRVDLAPGGILSRALGQPSIVVNSAHFQGIDDLGQKLAVEATSADGVVEGIRPSGGERILAVQWHPEWRVADNPVSRELFAWFGLLLKGASLREAAELVAEKATLGS